MPAVAVVAVAGIASSMIQAGAARDAANAQANAMRDAARYAQQNVDTAKRDILDVMVPALADYQEGINSAQQTIADGSADIMNILQTTTAATDQMFQSVGASARQALLGSAAQAQGIPRAQFDQTYNTATAETGQAPQTLEQLYAGITGQPELTRDATGAIGTVADVRQSAMAAASQPPGALPAQTVSTPEAISGLGAAVGGVTAADIAPGAESFEGQLPTITPEARLTMPGVEGVTPQPGTIETAPAPGGVGFYGAQAQLQRGEDVGLANLAQSTNIARGDILAGIQGGMGSIAAAREGAIADFSPYTQAGQAAIEQEAALSGALGPEAQQAAINSFIESPGQKYLREQQEKALLRSGAAIGGLGGGRIRSALMEQAMGIAATQQQQQLENLRSLGTRGQQAAGNVAGIRVGTGTTEAGMQMQAASQLADLAKSFGMNVSQLMNLTSQQKAALAERTGINLAQLEQTIGTARAAGIQNLGQGLAITTASATGDIAGLTERGAANVLQGKENLSQMFGNLATFAGGQITPLIAGQGSALAAGQMAQGQIYGQALQGLGNVAAYGYNQNMAMNQGQPMTTTYS